VAFRTPDNFTRRALVHCCGIIMREKFDSTKLWSARHPQRLKNLKAKGFNKLSLCKYWIYTVYVTDKYQNINRAILIKCIAMLLDTKFICLVLICLINKMKLRLIKMDWNPWNPKIWNRYSMCVQYVLNV